MPVFIAAFAILTMIGIFMYVLVIRQNITLIRQRDIIADALMEEHRMRHNCVGPLYVAWDVGEITHTRHNEVFNDPSS